MGVLGSMVASLGWCGCLEVCGFLFVVWKFPVCKLEVGLLNFFGMFFCCELFVLFVVGSFQSVSWKSDF